MDLLYINVTVQVDTHQHSVWVMPAVPQDPEPHGTGQELRLENLILGQVRRHPILGLDVWATTSPTIAEPGMREVHTNDLLGITI